MNQQAVVYCAERIRELIDPEGRIDARQEASGDTVHHFLWMCDQITSGVVTGNKSHRWLGYLQCGMVFSGEEHLDLSSMKELSRSAAEKFPDPERYTHQEYERLHSITIGDRFVWPEKRL